MAKKSKKKTVKDLPKKLYRYYEMYEGFLITCHTDDLDEIKGGSKPVGEYVLVNTGATSVTFKADK